MQLRTVTKVEEFYTCDIKRVSQLFQGFKSLDMLELYDINPIFSFNINELRAIYLFFTLLIVKLFLQAMALQYFLHRFVVVSSHLMV